MGREWDEMQGAARREVEEARLRFTQEADRAGREAMSAGRTISALVYDELDRRGGDLSDGLQHIAEKMRDMAATGDGDPPRMVRQAVDMIDDLSQRLRDRTARDMGDKVARFGRKYPMTFVTACVVGGVLAGRVLIAKSEEQDGTQHRGGVDDDRAGGPGHGGSHG